MIRNSSINLKFIAFLLAAILPFLLSCSVSESDYLVYIGTYTGKGSEGIYAYRFNSRTGTLTPIGLAVKTENPSYLVVDAKRRFLYAVNETDQFSGEASGAISVFSVNRVSGALTLMQQVASLGASPCHLSFDRTGNYLMVANYKGGNAAVFPIGPDGKLGPSTAFIQSSGSSVQAGRQDGPHAHFIQAAPYNWIVTIADLGTDQILVYRFDVKTGALRIQDSSPVSLPPGSGPRHMTFTSSGRLAYVINELFSTVTCFSMDSGTGQMASKQTIPTLPKEYTGPNTAAEIVLSPSEKHLYVSNRGDDSIGLFSVDAADGRLTVVEWVSSGGKTPRHIEIDPSGKWLLAANQNSGNVKVFRVEPFSGKLKPTDQNVNVANPVCVRFVSIE